jgi:hypothetical protein
MGHCAGIEKLEIAAAVVRPQAVCGADTLKVMAEA